MLIFHPDKTVGTSKSNREKSDIAFKIYGQAKTMLEQEINRRNLPAAS